MAMKVLWTPNANRSYEYIITCATDYYGKSLLRKLVSDIQRAEMLLADNPLLGSMEPLAANRNFDYRYIVLSKPFKLIYTVYDGVVYIADLWDTRQSPERLSERIK